MKNKEFAEQLEERTIDFGALIISISSDIKYSIEAKIIRNQLTRSGTSIGANYHEANRARTKAEFRSKIRICEGEAVETLYWIKLAIRTKLIDQSQVIKLKAETIELLALFSSIGKKLRNN